ncbi:hypothetical protein F2Q70_00038364 [Brassica cretica]|uniref:Uncharacterized protein n=1 Tax=Brassica cretica TaxID=69181 RepID=A0A8S9KCM2_BRACR|nr:hypothetical protein F2Q70_00038364 [Brassica cretica]
MANWIRLIQLAVGRVGDGSSNSPNGESDLVHPSRPTASRIDWSDSPLGELGVACPFYLATGRSIPGFVASMLDTRDLWENRGLYVWSLDFLTILGTPGVLLAAACVILLNSKPPDTTMIIISWRGGETKVI